MKAKRRAGKLMNRRETLGAFGALGAAFVFRAGSSADASSASERSASTHAGGVSADALDCIVAPELTEGPFFVEEELNRSNLTIGTKEPFVTKGLPLLLNLGVFKLSGGACVPLIGARVDIWHASAEGMYSDEPSGRIQRKNTVGEKYLRGYQTTDQSGTVKFVTIYPGWYAGRTVHIHFKMRSRTAPGREAYDFTSELFFNDDLNDVVLAKYPYDTRGTRRVRNSNDGIYRHGRGSDLLLSVQPAGSGKGYVGSFNIGLRI